MNGKRAKKLRKLVYESPEEARRDRRVFAKNTPNATRIELNTGPRALYQRAKTTLKRMRHNGEFEFQQQ